MSKKLHWVSWSMPDSNFRPGNYPPGENILAWWCTGSTPELKPIVSAWVLGTDKEDIKATIEQDWYEIENILTLEQKDKIDNSTRFPINLGWTQLRTKPYV